MRSRDFLRPRAPTRSSLRRCSSGPSTRTTRLFATRAWQPLSAALSSLGPYEIGVKLQATTAEANRQAAQVDIVSEPAAPVPASWTQTFDPYLPFCEILAGTPGEIQETGARIFHHATVPIG